MSKSFQSLDSGDVLLFDRKCLAMMHPLSTAICGAAKIASRFDHVGIVLRITSEELKQYPEVERAISQESPSECYVVEANLAGVTVRSLEARLGRSSSNAIAVRRLVGANRDTEYHKKFNAHVSKLLGFRYRDNVSELMSIALDPPDRSEDREIARQLLNIRAQLDNIRRIRGNDGDSLHDSVFLENLETKCVALYHALASKVSHHSIDNNVSKSVVCSEVVASCLQAVDVLSQFPSYSSYLPRDFDELRSQNRVVFSDGGISLAKTEFLTPLSQDSTEQISIRSDQKETIDLNTVEQYLASVNLKSQKSDLAKPLLKISQAFIVSSFFTSVLWYKQVQRQLRWAQPVRGSLLTFTFANAFRVATASSLHVHLSQYFDQNVRDYFTLSAVDLGHPFYDTIFRGGALGALSAALTLPIEILTFRYHFYGYRNWYSIPLRSALACAVLSFLTMASYCGAFCWPMYYESISPFLLPLSPSIFRNISGGSEDEVARQRFLGLTVGFTSCALHQIAVYPLESVRLRFCLDRKPSFRNPFLGFKYFVARGVLTSFLTYNLL